MNKVLKRILKILLIVLGFLLIVVLAGAFYFNGAFLSFGLKQSQPDSDIAEIQADGFSFRDLNRNGSLDAYEDARLSIADRAEDLLGRLSLEEKVNLLKGSGIKSLLSMDYPVPAGPRSGRDH